MENEIMLSNHELAASATAAQAKAEIECAYVMAVRRPRNIEDVRTKILSSCKRPIFSESAEWTKPVGKSTISGPSIRFVETALQAYGNVRTSTTVVYEDDTIRKVHVSVIDLENNSSYGKDITLSKSVERKFVKPGQKVISERLNSFGDKVFLVEATEDEMSNKQGSAESKIIRNCGLRLIPQDIVEEAMETAKKARESNLGDPQAAKKKIIDAFSNLGIKPSELEKFTGKKIEQFLPADIDRLRTVYTAIKEGEAKWSDYLTDAQVEPSTVAEKLEKAKAKKTAPKEPETVVDPPKLALTDAQKALSNLENGVLQKAMADSGYTMTQLQDLSDDQVVAVMGMVKKEAPNGRNF